MIKLNILFLQRYGLWHVNDKYNIEVLVSEMKKSELPENCMDNGKLLLDVLPRSALGFEFSIETVSILIKQYLRK
jgi:hypothetical protein